MTALLIIAAAVANLAEGFTVKQYNARHGRGGFFFTALVAAFSMCFFSMTNTDGFSAPPTLWIYAICAGILYCLASFTCYIALGCGSFATSMLILSYSLVFSIGYGLIFLQEEASLPTWIGLGLMLISLYLTRDKANRSELKKKTSLKWLICILAAFCGNGLFCVIQRMQQIRFENRCTNEFMIIALSVAAVTLFAVGLLNNRKDLGYVFKKGLPWAALAGLSNGITNALALTLTMLIPISAAAPIREGTKILLSFPVSRLMFREKFEKRKIVGFLVGAVAIILLNI